MYILGISAFYHDSTAALLKDGKIVAAAAEERFSGRKHDHSFPDKAVDFCLKFEKIKKEDIDYIVFYEKPIIKFDRILDTHLKNYPFAYKLFSYAIPLWVKKKLKIKFLIKDKLGKFPLFTRHHISHSASAYYLSGFSESAVITFDSVGEWNTLSIGIGRGNKLNILKTIDFPDSLGLLYSTVTAFLGFKVNNGEGKVMGLASYGKPIYKEKFKKLITVFSDGSFRLKKSYFAYSYSDRMYSKKIVKLFGDPRKPEGTITKRDKDLAATLQWLLEDIALKIVRHTKEITKMDNLSLSGGVVLNSVMNGKILKSGIFNKYFFLPIGGDGGASVGGALYLWRNVLNNNYNEPLSSLYFGPKYSDEEILTTIKNYKLNYKTTADINEYIADMLIEQKIIGWFQGRMELGQRALGNRSILADPRNPKMKDIINGKVKHRESFRPFAPSMLEEKFAEYFGIEDAFSPYMILCLPVLKNKVDFPAAIHIDGTARIQTVNKKDNKKYYDLIDNFYKKTGIPVILNTSFNVRGKPIVCSPEDAVLTFLRTEIDILVMGDLIIEK